MRVSLLSLVVVELCGETVQQVMQGLARLLMMQASLLLLVVAVALPLSHVGSVRGEESLLRLGEQQGVEAVHQRHVADHVLLRRK